MHSMQHLVDKNRNLLQLVDISYADLKTFRFDCRTIVPSNENCQQLCVGQTKELGWFR